MSSNDQYSLDAKYTATSGKVMMTGIQALVRTTLDQRRLDAANRDDTGLLVSGYQGSPLGGIDREMAAAERFLTPERILFRQGLNEELAATAIAGTQLLGQLDNRQVEGVTGIWFGKNPGLDRAADAIRHANISGTAPLGGAIAWIGDDPSSKSSTVPSSCEPMCRSLMMPLLAPGSVGEVLSLGLHAIAMSRYSGLWTGLKIVADVADSTATVDLDGVLASIPKMPRRLSVAPPVLLPPTNLDAELDLMTNRLARAQEYARAARLNRVTHQPPRASLVVLAAGMGYQAVTRALSDLNLDATDLDDLGIRLVQLGMPWPLDAADLRSFVQGADTVLVVEDKLPFVESAVKEALFRVAEAPHVFGKFGADESPLLSARSALTSDDVIRALRRLRPAEQRFRASTAVQYVRTQLNVLPSRTPAFCSGCPHSVSTRAEPDQLVGVGIGCHIMVALEDRNKRGDLVGMPQMGGEGGHWLGLEPFTADDHFIQNLGDGTFYHSGSLALRASVAAGVNVTYRLLFNDVVAMTGGQRPSGQMDIPSLTRWLANEGVQRVVITTSTPKVWRRVKLDPIASVRRREDIDVVQRELAEQAGVTVLLHIDRCATEERRLRKRGKVEAPADRVWINERVCEGCGDCGDKSSCLSVLPTETEFGRKTQIHQSSCNQDFSCLKGDCPSFVMVKPGSSPERPRVPLTDEPLPPPDLQVGRNVLIRMPGVGGTGVVTVSQILQMAAHLDGLFATGLEQIGLAQKGGPVLSDVRISEQPIDGQLRAGRGTADVLIGFDALGAAAPDNLKALASDRAIAVVNRGITPTAAMVQDVTARPAAWLEIEELIDEATIREANLYVDAQELAERFFDDHMPTNMILLGAAFQHGVLPITLESVEQAIRLNRVAVETNLEAFRLGRLAASREHLLTAATQPVRVTSPGARSLVGGMSSLPSDLVPTLERYVDELIAYQSPEYAALYVSAVDDTAARAAVRFEDSREVARAFASGLFKLMAYKDEYEVARLHLDGVERAKLVQAFGEGASVRIMLHPPLLRALGVKRKLAFGSWFVPALRCLYAARRLRGTRLDIFGLAEVRRVERALPAEYEALVHETLDPATHVDEATVLGVCELPDLIRGYEDIKLQNVALFRLRASELLAPSRGKTALLRPSASLGAVDSTKG